MKLLMFQASRFAFRPHESAPGAPTPPDRGERAVDDAAVIFIHAEPADVDRHDRVLAKAAKNVKWIANKRALKTLVLHSFNHLAEEKAPAEFAGAFIDALAARLGANGYQVEVTPFGWSCEWNMAVRGEPLAKVFKSL